MAARIWLARRWLPALAALLLISAGLLLAANASAAQQDGPRRKFRSGDEITIAANETVPHDLYVAASTLTVDGVIEGDLTLLAREVRINGRVTGDLLGAASRVTIAGTVDGDARVTGASVIVGGQVGKDLLSASRTIQLQQGATIRGDLIYVAPDSDLQGTISGGILTTSGEVPVVAPAYASATTAGTGTGAGGGPLPQRNGDDDGGGNIVSSIFFRFLPVFLAGLILLLVGRRTTWFSAGLIRRRPLNVLGVGALTLLIMVVALVVVAIAIFDLFINRSTLGETILIVAMAFFSLLGGSVLLFLLLIAAVFLGQAVTGLAIGRLIFERVDVPARSVIALAVGALLVTALTLLPAIGGVLLVIATVFGVGALLLGMRWGGEEPVVTPSPVPSPTA